MHRPLKEPLVGVQYKYVKDIRDAVDTLHEMECNYICSGLLSDEAIANYLKTGAKVPAEEFWSDTALTSKEWAAGLVCVLPNLDKELEHGEQINQKRAANVLNKILEYSHHLNISAVMLEITNESNNVARILSSKLKQPAQHYTFWVTVPVGSSGSGDDEVWDDESTDAAWSKFKEFRMACENETRLSAVLKLGANLPEDFELIERWVGETPVALCLPLEIFQTNQRGFPVLSPGHQKVVKMFLRLGLQVVLQAEEYSESTSIPTYKAYISHLFKCLMDEPGNPNYPQYSYSAGWENYLQIPLQPLMDNLESTTYETFERDPNKYMLYYDALCLALQKKSPSEDEEQNNPLIVVVAGAGRGPLVNATIRAANTVQVKVKIYALEKNRNADITLNHLNVSKWNGEVTVVCADMRSWKAPEKADIIVSELLGSFGDNELSPECLDGAQRFLKADGIIIPEEYTSFVAPIMSQTMCNELHKHRRSDLHAHCESTYVVFMTRNYNIAKPKGLFTFQHPHPIPEEEDDRTNDRYKTLEFNIAKDCDCHGFAGYFESTLFQGPNQEKVVMSILPETHSPGMFSWFPLFIPLRRPVSLKKGDTLTARFWRKSTSTKVWYEWRVVSPENLPIHNLNGCSSFIGLDLAD